MKKPAHLIINNPFVMPRRHWKYDRKRRKFELAEGRRPAGYVRATPGSKAFDDPGIFVPIELVEKIRPRVDAWRDGGRLGVTAMTRALLEHWYDEEARDSSKKFFFCQLEAIETLIWLIEGPAAEKQGIEIPGDGGPFSRLCSKMATGSGKTIIMSMIIAWQVLNKVANKQDKRFSKNILAIAPGLTVRQRLQVLLPDRKGNYYDEFNIVPESLRSRLRQGRVRVVNWHKLNWETQEQIKKRRGVDKRGAKSDEAYVRGVLGDMAGARNIIVINDEAHHAWRVPVGAKIKGLSREDKDQATKWIGGLDRIHRARGVLQCFDLSATPFVPSGRQADEEALFSWIVSDFGLNDAIEAGLVKTPRIVVRDDGTPDAKTYRSKLYHIYEAEEDGARIKDDLTRKAEPQEQLPQLVQNAYYLLGKDWLETKKAWEKAGHTIPPAMISVVNRTETAARVKHMFDHRDISIDELCDRERTLHIDSKVLGEAESQDEALLMAHGNSKGEEDGPVKKLTRAQQAELLRKMVDTVGKQGEPGEQVQNVISVGMLSEGWDAKTVTHIMGLRAFSSQLLCEQVIGRGLRRTTYDLDGTLGTFAPEYVNIFGVPFTFMPHEGEEGPPPPPPPPKTTIEPDAEKKDYLITWPNVIRVEHVLTPRLDLDWKQLKPLELDASTIRFEAELAGVVDGKPHLSQLTEIQLQELGVRFRIQKMAFEAASRLFQTERPNWHGNDDFLLAQLVRIVERFLVSGKLDIKPDLFRNSELHKRVLIALSMSTIVQHLKDAIHADNTESRHLIFDDAWPIRSTGDMRTWYTSKPCERAKRSHINFCVFDSTWEACEAYVLDKSDHVKAWVKNDHLGFEIIYIYRGSVRKYRPDFLIRLTSGTMLVLEVKGQDNQQNKAKRAALDEWCEAVTSHGGFGCWVGDISFAPKDVGVILEKHAEAAQAVK